MADIIEFPKIERITEQNARWKAVIEYRSENGPMMVERYFDELFELHDFVERGPDWNAIVRIETTLNRYSQDIPRITVEQAEMI